MVPLLERKASARHLLTALSCIEDRIAEGRGGAGQRHLGGGSGVCRSVLCACYMAGCRL